MRHYYSISFLLLLLVFCCIQSMNAQVNGEQFTVDGVEIVHVWGTHTEMGYAHGYLLSEDIMRIVSEYMFTVISPDDYKSFALPLFQAWMSIPADYQQELDGMLLGIQDGGSSIYVEELERDLTSEDLAVMNSIVDFWVILPFQGGYDLACSSTCGWGDGTSMDPDTPSGTLHCRDMDWTDTPNYLLGKSTVIISYEPSEAEKQSWISISYPGYIGCLSGMNASGTGTTLNLGNNMVTPSSTSGNVPICMQTRAAIEGLDPNGDSFHNAEDVWEVLNGQSRIPSTIVHAFGKAQGAGALDPPSMVVESNHTGIAKRVPFDEPDLDPWFIGATNHHRKLYSAAPCWRYDLIVDDVSEDYRVDTDEMWQIETDVSVSTTMHTMLFRPDVMDLYLAVSTNATPAPYHYRSYIAWDQMFTAPGTPTTTPTPTSTQPPNPTDTPSPTVSPTPTCTPTTAITSTPTMTPSPSHTPAPTDTPHGFEEFNYDLKLNRSEFTGGDAFILSRSLEIPEPVTGTLECVILDVAEYYWFWPGWTQDFQGNAADFEIGRHELTVLEFTWPENVEGSASGLRFWAALLTENDLQLLTNVDLVEFSYR